MGTNVCENYDYEYWDNRSNPPDSFKNGEILQPLFQNANGNREELDLACKILCLKDENCYGYAVASDTFWEANDYVCSLSSSCSSPDYVNVNYHGYMKGNFRCYTRGESCNRI